MKNLVRLTVLIGALVLASGAPAYARGGGGGGHGGGFGGGHAGGGHAFGGSHGGGFGGHHGFDGHHDFDGHHFDHDRFHGRGFIGFGPSFYWGPYWDAFWPYGPYGPYAYAPSATSVEAPPVYIEKPQAGYCPSAHASYPDVQSCAQPWVRVAPHAGSAS